VTASKNQARALVVALLVTVNVVLWGMLVLPSVRSISSADSAEPSTPAEPSSSSAPGPSASTQSGDTADSRSSDTGNDGGAESTADASEPCRREVRAAARVIKAAKAGVGHWSEHVQAQTDANSGKINDGQMAAIFARTRLAGPADLERYEKALTAYEKVDASCGSVEAAADDVSETLAQCAARHEAQQEVITTGEDAMADWESHQAAMRRSRAGHVHGAQEVWLRAWRAAPPHINAFQDAVSRLEQAPQC
jgi:hypothetical protein